MSDIQQRNYYKIFTGTNQTDGYDKVHLGYEASTTEIIFPKDKTTYFHVPFFAESQNLNDSTLVADGATPGPIPALADRIYKKLGNYGNTTPWGTPKDRPDGTWLCSWLYAVSSEPPVWYDRYYNPGRLKYTEALQGLANFTDYEIHNPVYYDIPSTLTLDSSVLYQYFHQGEQTASEAVDMFAGDDKTHLKINIEDWTCGCPHLYTHPVDSSIYQNTVTIKNFNMDWIVNLFDPGYLDRSSLSFNHTDFVDCRVIYDQSYNLENEFTICTWINNPDWQNATSTEILGNLQKGGFGLFYNNLNYNPYFVIPENTYGHLFYFNQDGNLYNEVRLKASPNAKNNSNPVSININSNSETVVLDSTNKLIIKYNHLGDTITFSKNVTGDYVTLAGTPKLSILDRDCNSIVVTTSGTYIFDRNLILKSLSAETYYGYNSLSSTSFEYKERLAFDINGELVREPDCVDVKFDSLNQKWVIKADKNLYCDETLQTQIPNTGSSINLAVDPEGYIWVVTSPNTIYKIEPYTKNIIGTFEIGIKGVIDDICNLSFIKYYDRKVNTFTWYAYVYHNSEQTLYKLTLDGNTAQTYYLPYLFNIQDPVTASQDKTLATFTSKGDYTGYEWRRIFNNVLYNNNPQIQFKVAVKSPNRTIPSSIYTLSVPVQYLVNNTWQFINVILKNNFLSLYINNYLRDSMEIPGNLSFDYQYKNDLFIGTPCGKSENFNTEINTTSIIWNGYIDSVQIYDYAIEPKMIPFFIRKKILASDVEWNISTAALQYVEVIDRFFKHRLPGFKSPFLNIRLTGAQITDPKVRLRIEDDIKLAVEQIKPAYVELIQVEWID